MAALAGHGRRCVGICSGVRQPEVQEKLRQARGTSRVRPFPLHHLDKETESMLLNRFAFATGAMGHSAVSMGYGAPSLEHKPDSGFKCLWSLHTFIACVISLRWETKKLKVTDPRTQSISTHLH